MRQYPCQNVKRKCFHSATNLKSITNLSLSNCFSHYKVLIKFSHSDSHTFKNAFQPGNKSQVFVNIYICTKLFETFQFYSFITLLAAFIGFGKLVQRSRVRLPGRYQSVQIQYWDARLRLGREDKILSKFIIMIKPINHYYTGSLHNENSKCNTQNFGKQIYNRLTCIGSS